MRDKSLDTYKGLLVVFMVLAHVIQFLGDRSKIQSLISLYANLTTFSCFVFVFGIIYQKVYFNKEFKIVKINLRKNILKLVVAFYISGLFYRVLISKKVNLLKLFLILDIPGYSEFLLSFALLSLISYIFFSIIKKLTKNEIIFLILLSSVSTFIPYSKITNLYLGLFIGTNKFSCFPVVQYSSYFLMGIYYEKFKVDVESREIFVSVIVSSTIILYYIRLHRLPTRFPPSIFWIFGGYLFALIYLKICKLNLCFFETIKINKIGEKSLLYLVLSNIFIFISLNFFKNLNLFKSIILTLLIIVVIYVCNYFFKIVSFSLLKINKG